MKPPLVQSEPTLLSKAAILLSKNKEGIEKGECVRCGLYL